MFKRNKKVELANLKKILDTLKQCLRNEYLLEEIMFRLDCEQENNSISFINDNNIVIANQKNGDLYTLSIEKDKIITKYTCWNNRHHESKKIEFNGSTIIVTEKETTDYQVFETNEPTGSEKKEKYEVYKNNELAYRRELELKIDTNLTNTNSYAIITETYIDTSKKAFQKKMVIGDINAFYETDVRYSKSDYYDVPPFDTLDRNQCLYSYGMSTTTKDQYELFIDNIKKSETLEVKTLKKA